MPFNEISGTDQHNTASARRLNHEFVARFEPGLAQRVDRQRRLVLTADARVPAPSPMLYFVHDK